MNRERVLKVLLVVVGLLFTALIYPMTMFVRQEPALAMMLSLYVTLGIMLLRPRAIHRSIAALSPSPHGRASHTPPSWTIKHSRI